MVTSKSTTLLLQFPILCMPVTCKVINEILKFGSSSRQREGGGGLHYISAALAPTQSNVASESKLPDEMDRFLFKKLSQFCTKAAKNLNKFTTITFMTSIMMQGHCRKFHFSNSSKKMFNPVFLICGEVPNNSSQVKTFIR